MNSTVKIVTIEIPKDDARRIEQLSYEAKARKDMLAFMINQQVDPKQEAFIECKADCIRYAVDWAKAQDHVEQAYLQDYPNRRRWWLEPGTNQLKLEIVADET